MTEQSPVDLYFEGFGRRLVRLARDRGVPTEPPALDPHLVAEVLELAGAVAHAGERKFAPLASFVTGVVVGRLQAAGALVTGQEVAAFVAELKKELDATGQA